MNVQSDKTAPPVILILEPDVVMRMALAGYLRECGYKVIEAGDGDDVCRLMETDISVDLVLADVAAPGQRAGFVLARWLRQQRPSLKILLTSGVRRSAQQAATLCEEGPLLTKPYDHADLERRIRILLAAEQNHSE